MLEAALTRASTLCLSAEGGNLNRFGGLLFRFRVGLQGGLWNFSRISTQFWGLGLGGLSWG